MGRVGEMSKAGPELAPAHAPSMAEAALREMVDQKRGAAADVLTNAGALPGGAASGGAGVRR